MKAQAEIGLTPIRPSKFNKRKWLYLCSCGKQKEIDKYSVSSGTVRSCGCLYSRSRRSRNDYHGYAGKELYSIWQRMKRRCYNKRDNRYHCYGARGIKVCKEWRHSPEVFILWAKEHGWQLGLTIERINNDKGYSPNNCRFATHSEQIRNTSRNVHVTVHNETLIAKDACRKYKISWEAVKYRVHKLGMSYHDAFTKPKMK